MNNQIPDSTDQRWRAIVLGDIYINFDFFPTKLLLARIKLQIKRDPSPQIIDKGIIEFRELFVKNQHIPKAKKDLNKIFKKKNILLRIFRR